MVVQNGAESGGPERPEFVDANLRGARFVRSDLTAVVMRAVDVAGADIDDPWLLDGESRLLVNGVDVTPYVESQLNARFPGRELRRADDPGGLREAWAAVERAWSDAVVRVAGMPTGTPDVSIDGEWSFAQTLRHLVMATDTWLRGAVQGVEAPYHPIGQPNEEYEKDGYDISVFSTVSPSYEAVRLVRADRQAMVGQFLASVSAEELAEMRPNPWAPTYSEPVASCVRTILEEEWEHLRYALRDLDEIEVRGIGDAAEQRADASAGGVEEPADGATADDDAADTGLGDVDGGTGPAEDAER